MVFRTITTCLTLMMMMMMMMMMMIIIIIIMIIIIEYLSRITLQYKVLLSTGSS